MFMWIITLACLFEFNLAELMSCTEITNKTDICSNGIANHGTPKSVDTTLSLRQISDLDLGKNSISIQVRLWTYWTDPSLVLSNNSTE